MLAFISRKSTVKYAASVVVILFAVTPLLCAYQNVYLYHPHHFFKSLPYIAVASSTVDVARNASNCSLLGSSSECPQKARRHPAQRHAQARGDRSGLPRPQRRRPIELLSASQSPDSSADMDPNGSHTRIECHAKKLAGSGQIREEGT